MQDRLKYLEAQEHTEEIKWRIQEITLAIVRVQQLLLANVSKSEGNEHKDTLIAFVEKELNPKYMNDLFSWGKIEKAIKKAINGC